MVKYNDYKIVFENEKEFNDYFSHQYRFIGQCDKQTNTPLKKIPEHFPCYLQVEPTYLDYDYKWVEKPIDVLRDILTNDLDITKKMLDKIYFM